MDAPKSQYRVIERGGRLIVLESRTNLPPKPARDLIPTRKQPVPRKAAPPPLPEAVEAPAPPEIAARLEPAPEEDDLPFWDDPPGGLADFPLSARTMAGVAVGVVVLGIAIGGMFGFVVAAIAIVAAGRYALQKSGAS